MPNMPVDENFTHDRSTTWFDCLVPSQDRCARVEAPAFDPCARKQLSITIVERLSPHTALLSWSDPRLGCMAEQTWTFGRARQEDVCALSGELIKRGDPVYRPRKTTPPALNARCVIAAHHVVDAMQSFERL